MLDSEKLELAIYQCVKSVGIARSVSISNFLNSPGSGGQFNLVVERLTDLRRRGCINLSKFVGDVRVSYDRFVEFEGEEKFFSGYFEIEIAPGGRKFFEELEKRAEREAQTKLVFISCGQFAASEKQLGKSLASVVDELASGFRGYFAENQNSADSLCRHVFKAIDECAGFVAVMHNRGDVSLGGQKYMRASIWIEQEIAIASFLAQIRERTFPVLCYIQKGIKLEGVRTLLLTNGNEFADDAEVLADFRMRLKDGRFKPQF